jgi:hypothetical protein
MKMESNPTTTPTIAELWREIQSFEAKKMRECPECGWHGGYHQAKCNGAENINANEWPLTLPAMRAQEFKALRVQLIERCKRVQDGFDSWRSEHTSFEVLEMPSGIGIRAQNNVAYSSCHDAASAREMSSAYAFWAWELEQLQREKDEKSPN